MMEDLSLHILDIVENSIAAKAQRVAIRVEELPSRDRLVLEVSDDGRGMSPRMLARALDPFVTTKRAKRIGLGLPLLAQAARATGGRLTLRSWPGRGTRVRATFCLSHIDLQPLGDMAETLSVLMVGHPDVRFRYTHRTDTGSYVFRSSPSSVSPGEMRATGGIKRDIRSGIARIRRKP
jgi:hypothetical protein